MKRVAEVWHTFWWYFDHYWLDVAGWLSLASLALWLYNSIRHATWWVK